MGKLSFLFSLIVFFDLKICLRIFTMTIKEKIDNCKGANTFSQLYKMYAS